MKTIGRFLLPILFLTPLLFSCEENKEHVISSEDSVYVFVDEIMHSWYLWYDEVPEVDIFKYSHPSTLLNALIYEPLDKWSYIDYAETIEAYYEEGEYFGFGFYLRFDDSDKLRVIIVYENSEAYKRGIRKGDYVLSIDDTKPIFYYSFESLFNDSPQTVDFIFNSNGVRKYLTLSKSTIKQNAVHFSDTYQVGDKLVGYMVYDSFLGYSKPELEETINFFKTSGIDDLIVDLRYNGGGYVNIAKEFAEMLIPKEKVGEVFLSTVHNDLAGPTYDSTEYLAEHPLNLDLDRVFFITSQFTASASELLINCLDPHMEVITIGSTTHGKPVGMYGFKFHEWLMLPVTVLSVNAEDYGEYYDGLPVDASAGEGMDKTCGDITDPNLVQAFNYINYGSFSAEKYISPKASVFNEKLMLTQKRNVMLFNR